MKFEAIKNRKTEHLDIFEKEDVNFQNSSGFEKYRLIHDSLPEQNFEEVDVSQDFLGYQLSMPFMVSAITGGFEKGTVLNQQLSEVASRHNIAFALGSMRACFENHHLIKSFAQIKANNQVIPIIGNIGGQQLLDYTITQIEDIVESTKIDALAIHLNPLQEVLQPEGDKKFAGIKDKILKISETLTRPIIIKEVGFGLPIKNILELSARGINWFDLAGSGGTSWVKIEKHRISSSVNQKTAEEFEEFGIPTAEILEKAVKIDHINLIATGGINRALDFAKAIALGAKLSGSAGKILNCWNTGGSKAVDEMLKVFYNTLKISVFITGCKNLEEYREFSNIEPC
ncbi:MAG: type 2 isopentenyl-diphosphate Delta-isomerase [Candidatus Marinimicrobia bacterium]|nr:type 2 isopentenyl-diphosphate Delta-isomerase [Candidatus Neomarinimicrobiota bacterium]